MNIATLRDTLFRRKDWRRFAIPALLLWVALSTCLALWPFTFAKSCLVCTNGGKIDASTGKLIFSSDGLAVASVPEQLSQRIIDDQAITIELFVKPYNTSQAGPARIVSNSSNPFQRNFMIGQQHDDLIARFRSNALDPNGLVGEIEVSNVFVANQPTYIQVSSGSHGTWVGVNAGVPVQVSEEKIDFTSWSDDFDLVIGNEATGNRAWLGEVDRIIVRTSDGKRALADFNFRSDAVPFDYLLTERDLIIPSKLPLPFYLPEERFRMNDFISHFGMLLPIGLLCYAIASRNQKGWQRLVFPTLTILAFATAIEVIQHFSLTRTMSLLDLFWGLAGGFSGVLFSAVVLAQTKR